MASVRLLRRGDVIQIDGREEVVRHVEIVAQLANGQTVKFPTEESVEILPPEEISEDLAAEAEELDSE